MNAQRFNQTAVQILQTLTEAKEQGALLPSRPTEEQLLEFIAEAKRVHYGEAQCEAQLKRAGEELTKLRSKLEELPQWFYQIAWGTLPEVAQKRALEAGQWVMIIAPSADSLSWFTVAERLMGFRVTTYLNKDRLAIAVGTKSR